MGETNSEVRTTCPYCGVGCGIRVSRGDQVGVRGDESHPANFGRLCSKGAALGETLDLHGRLLYPEIGGVRVSWEEALEAVARGFGEVLSRHGQEAVAFYVSGQLLTEDYYVANKLMKGFLGSANIDTNSRLCMSSSVAGHQRAFGADSVPGNYEDLDSADLMVLVGSNLAWCHPVLYQRIAAARRQRPDAKLVVIDPRRTLTCDGADLHLALKPGTDTDLFNGLLHYLHEHDRIDSEFLEAHTQGYWSAVRAARDTAKSIPQVARRCGLGEADVAAFYDLFGRTDKTVTVYSQGVNQSSCGTDKVNAIINCHLATGRIGRPGMGPFSVTGQPNAMGGREVGGLANQLAAHMDFTPEALDRVERFWGAANLALTPGLKALDMFDAVADGRIKAIWIMATNPVVSLPDADRVRAALRDCELVVLSEACADTDTAATATIRLPALTWGEKDGTVTNSERRISRQRAFLPPPGAARPDWWIIAQVGRRLGFGEAFGYTGPAEIFREHAALSAFENDGTRDFDIGALAGLSDEEYDLLEPVQWPFPAGAGRGEPRLFAAGGFYTPSGRAQFVPVRECAPATPTDASYPLILNTGRVRDQWHTMTRTGKSPRLSAHAPEPCADIHPLDGLAWGIAGDSLVRVSSRWGEAIVRARFTGDQMPGSVFVPMHWGAPFASHARIGPVVNPCVDSVSGQPEFKHTPVRISPYRPAWHGFVLARAPLGIPEVTDYWVMARGNGFWRYEIAGETAPPDWCAWVRALAPLSGELPGCDWIDYLDQAAGRYRAAAVVDDRIERCVFVAPGVELPQRSWLAGLFAKAALAPEERLRLLAGHPGQGRGDGGRTVCSCFGVGEDAIVESIRARQLTTPEGIGAALGAGSNCGSCIPELRKLIAEAQTNNGSSLANGANG
jgi:assimilatory nitrate reductase catalytic subunit